MPKTKFKSVTIYKVSMNGEYQGTTQERLYQSIRGLKTGIQAAKERGKYQVYKLGFKMNFSWNDYRDPPNQKVIFVWKKLKAIPL